MKIHDNVLIVSMLSTRNKETGKYTIMQDGNLNSMLHEIYNNLDNINNLILTLPKINDIDRIQYSDFLDLIHEKFDSKIIPYHTKYYGNNVAVTRENMMKFYKEFKKINSTKKLDMIISEFPINYGIGIKVIYNYNWNKVSDDDNTPSAKYFDQELELSKYYETRLFSKIQYDYMTSKTDNHKNIKLVSRRYNPEFTKYQAHNELEKLIESNLDIEYITSLLEMHNVLFYPLRVEDPRYDFDKCYKYAQENEFLLITTNHTNVKIDKRLYPNVIDIQEHYDPKYNRMLYFYILDKLTKNDVILRYESDMHVSLIEQKILTKAKIISPNFSEQEIKNYIYD